VSTIAPFLDELESTPMTKSYKMLVLLAMANGDAFPGEITIELSPSRWRPSPPQSAPHGRPCPKTATRRLHSVHLEQTDRRLTGGRGTGGTPTLNTRTGVFRTTFVPHPMTAQAYRSWCAR